MLQGDVMPQASRKVHQTQVLKKPGTIVPHTRPDYFLFNSRENWNSFRFPARPQIRRACEDSGIQVTTVKHCTVCKIQHRQGLMPQKL
ncbi:hypothetical protein AV530_016028 [Patagioenas fasciata monilis]|uniref:Uncharacterized protein n=1 Tax=Patagioenas fasciata monilis TaxID=372326 RepID=A0A1V4KJU9_PATFA|nr:hypothetical protein AV530_016028 [Patagioenas fasciata monilis]